MVISACVIVKNEEKNLPQWLECVRHLADEIIVVDTGSTDKTVEIATDAGAKVYHFKWINDFAAAKNYALEQAKGDWIIFLDADEYFPPEDYDKVRKVIADYDVRKKIVGLFCQLINIDKKTNESLSSIYQVRLFRNVPFLRFSGKVHERLVNNRPSDNRILQVVSGIKIYHTGYSRDIIEEKVRRNLALLEERTKENKQDKMDDIYFADCYYGLREYAKAAEYAGKCIEKKLRPLGMETNMERVLISALEAMGEPDERIDEVVEQAIKEHTSTPEFLFIKGLRKWRQNDYALAEETLLKGVEFYDNMPSDVPSTLKKHNCHSLMPLVFAYLSTASRWRKDNAKAMEWCWRGLEENKRHTYLVNEFLRVLSGQDEVEIISVLNKIYSTKDSLFIAEQLDAHDFPKLSSYYWSKSGNKPSPIAYFHAGKIEAASLELISNLEVMYRFGLAEALLGRGTNINELLALVPDNWKKAYLALRGDSVELDKMVRDHIKVLWNIINSQCKGDRYEDGLVSIMIPAWNRPVFFEDALKSALSQTYTNVEVIVCDNSDDESVAEIAHKYVHDSRLRYYRNRETNCKSDNFIPFKYLARGEYIQWLMDDDVLEPDKIKKMVDCLVAHHEVKLVTSFRGVIDENNVYLGRYKYSPVVLDKECTFIDGKEVARLIFTKFLNFIGEPSAVLFRRQDLRKHYWQASADGYITISDIVMWLDLMEQGSCAIFRDALSYYRITADQEGKRNDVILRSRIEWLDLGKTYFEKGVFLNKKNYSQFLSELLKEKSVIKKLPHIPEELQNKYIRKIEEAEEFLARNDS